MSRYSGFAGISPPSVQEGDGARESADEVLVRRLKQLLLDEVDLHELGRLSESQRRVRLERVLAHLVSREGIILSTRERTSLVRRVVDEAVGLGVLEPILADPSVSEIMINGHENIYVERFGRLERISSAFTSNEQLLQTIDRIVSAVNRRVDESSPMVDARLPADSRMPRGARVNVVLPPLALNGPTMTIRLFPKAYGMDELLENGASVRGAFEHLRSRSDSEALGQFVTAFLQSTELGAPLAESLNQIAVDMRRDHAQRMRRKAARLAPRVTLVTSVVLVPGTLILLLVGLLVGSGVDFGALLGGLR